MGVDQKAILILKNKDQDPHQVVSRIASIIEKYVKSKNLQHQELLKNLKIDSNNKMLVKCNYEVKEEEKLPSDYFNVTVEHDREELYQCNFIRFRFLNPNDDMFVEKRSMIVCWYESLNEENKDFELTHNQKLMSFSLSNFGSCNEISYEICKNLKDLAEPYIDKSDCDDVPYEDLETFFNNYLRAKFLVDIL